MRTRAAASVLFAALFPALFAACEKPKVVDVSGPPSSFSGTWSWVCCTGKLAGTLELRQNGTEITGEFVGAQERFPAVKGSVEGTMLRFTRGAAPNEQRYRLQVDASGEAMRGAFEGEHDPALGTDFVAHRISRSTSAGAAADSTPVAAPP